MSVSSMAAAAMGGAEKIWVAAVWRVSRGICGAQNDSSVSFSAAMAHGGRAANIVAEQAVAAQPNEQRGASPAGQQRAATVPMRVGSNAARSTRCCCPSSLADALDRVVLVRSPGRQLEHTSAQHRTICRRLLLSRVAAKGARKRGPRALCCVCCFSASCPVCVCCRLPPLARAEAGRSCCRADHSARSVSSGVDRDGFDDRSGSAASDDGSAMLSLSPSLALAARLARARKRRRMVVARRSFNWMLDLDRGWSYDHKTFSY